MVWIEAAKGCDRTQTPRKIRPVAVGVGYGTRAKVKRVGGKDRVRVELAELRVIRHNLVEGFFIVEVEPRRIALEKACLRKLSYTVEKEEMFLQSVNPAIR